MLNSLFETTTPNISVGSILITCFVSIALGIIIAFCYKKTSKYTKDFLVTLSLLPVLVEVVMLMVNGSLGTSIAILGAFSLVRFRSLPGTSKEILAVFFSMTVGLATGMGCVVFASVITILVSLVMIILSNIKFFEPKYNEKILRIVVPEDLDYTTMFDDIFKKYTDDFYLTKTKTTNMGSLFELSYRITLKDNINEKDFIDELRIKNNNLKVLLTHPIEESEM